MICNAAVIRPMEKIRRASCGVRKGSERRRLLQRSGARVVVAALLRWRGPRLLENRHRVTQIRDPTLQIEAPREQIIDLGVGHLASRRVRLKSGVELVQKRFDGRVHRSELLPGQMQAPGVDELRQIERKEEVVVVSDTRCEERG